MILGHPRQREALGHSVLAAELYRAVGNHVGLALALIGIGWSYARLGNHAQAIDCYQRSIDLYRTTGDRASEAESLDGQDDAHLAAGDVAAAHAGRRLALAIHEDLRDPAADRVRAKLSQR